jgi:predicted transcriptional regulator
MGVVTIMVISRLDLQKENLTKINGTKTLPANQTKILLHIARNGPIDAYRTNKDLAFSLSTTQLSFKTLKELGLIQLKDTVKGKTEQNRKIFDLTPFGFCLIAEAMLENNSDVSYDEVRKFLELHSTLFPDLLNKWDFFIERSRDYFSHNSVNWEQPLYLIPIPDISTNIWCNILRHTCRSINDQYRWDHNEVTVEKICNKYKQVLLNELYEDAYGPYVDGFVYALKQDKELWSELVPEVQSFIEDFKERIEQLEKRL